MSNKTYESDRADLPLHLPVIEQFAPGSHVAFLYSDDEDYRSVITRLMKHSLGIGLKILYISQQRKESEIRDWLGEMGGNPGNRTIKESINILSNSDRRTHTAFMDISHAAHFLEEELKSAVNDGWKGCCIIRDIHMVRKQKGIEMLRSDLSGFETVFASSKVLLVCTYRIGNFPSDVIQDVIRTHRYLIVEKEPVENIFYIPSSDAKVYNLASLELQHWIAALKNLTHKKAELESAREWYHDILENANDIIQSVGPDGKFLFVNRAWQENLEYSDEEIRELTIFDIVHPESKLHCERIFKEVMEGKDAGLIEASFLSKSGKKIRVQGRVNTRFWEGRPQYTRAIFRRAE